MPLYCIALQLWQGLLRPRASRPGSYLAAVKLAERRRSGQCGIDEPDETLRRVCTFSRAVLVIRAGRWSGLNHTGNLFQYLAPVWDDSMFSSGVQRQCEGRGAGNTSLPWLPTASPARGADVSSSRSGVYLPPAAHRASHVGPHRADRPFPQCHDVRGNMRLDDGTENVFPGLNISPPA